MEISSCGKLGIGRACPPEARLTPSLRGVTRPIVAQSTPAARQADTTAGASAAPTASSSAPDAMVPSGSSPKASQSSRPSASTDSLAIDPHADVGGLSQLPAGRREPALCGIVHGVNARCRARRARLGDHADAGSPEQLRRALDHGGGNAAPLGLHPVLAREDRGALERNTLSQQQNVPDPRAAGGDETILLHLAQHAADHDWPRQPGRHFRMAADQRHAELRARARELFEQQLHARLARAPVRQKERREEPERPRSPHRHVIGIDVERVPADLVRREGDGIGRGDEVAVAHVEDGSVLAYLGPHDHARVVRRVLAEESLEQLGPQFAYRQRRHGLRSIGAAQSGIKALRRDPV